MIIFLCQNGHKIQCSDELAGRQAKCPQCGVSFRVPHPTDGHSRDTASGSSAARMPPAGEPQIEFLCPNGHRLHGPRRMQGQAGQCPDCGAKFRIPGPVEPASSEAKDVEEAVLEEISQEILADASQHVEMPSPAAADQQPSHESTTEQAHGHLLGLRQVFTRLWERKTPGVSLVMHLQDGTKLEPQHFARAWSGEQHGLFFSDEADGHHTVTLIAWQAVTRIVVRGLTELPEGFAD